MISEDKSMSDKAKKLLFELGVVIAGKTARKKKYDQNGYESEEEFMKMFYGK